MIQTNSFLQWLVFMNVSLLLCYSKSVSHNIAPLLWHAFYDFFIEYSIFSNAFIIHAQKTVCCNWLQQSMCNSIKWSNILSAIITIFIQFNELICKENAKCHNILFLSRLSEHLETSWVGDHFSNTFRQWESANVQHDASDTNWAKCVRISKI